MIDKNGALLEIKSMNAMQTFSVCRKLKKRSWIYLSSENLLQSALINLNILLPLGPLVVFSSIGHLAISLLKLLTSSLCS
jgi:hypothetical protein